MTELAHSHECIMEISLKAGRLQVIVAKPESVLTGHASSQSPERAVYWQYYTVFLYSAMFPHRISLSPEYWLETQDASLGK